MRSRRLPSSNLIRLHDRLQRDGSVVDLVKEAAQRRVEQMTYPRLCRLVRREEPGNDPLRAAAEAELKRLKPVFLELCKPRQWSVFKEAKAWPKSHFIGHAPLDGVDEKGPTSGTSRWSDMDLLEKVVNAVVSSPRFELISRTLALRGRAHVIVDAASFDLETFGATEYPDGRPPVPCPRATLIFEADRERGWYVLTAYPRPRTGAFDPARDSP